WSIGDYVLSGGELPAMVMIDSISRFIPGVLGHQASAEEDSLITIALTICPRLNFELDPTETIDALMSCPIWA
ncbi:MAG: hypothetical protein ACTS4X_01860, partial [Candidatus Hodgkinia cicadicola]